MMLFITIRSITKNQIMTQSNLKILIDGNSFIKNGKLDAELATSTARIMLKEHKPWFISLVVNQENANLFSDVLSIYESFGIPTNVSEHPIADFRSEIKDGSDFVACSNDRLFCQLLWEKKGKIYHIDEDSYIDYKSIKEQLNIEPFWIPVIIATFGDPARGTMPIANITMPSLIDIINSNGNSIRDIAKSILALSPTTDPKELEGRIKDCYQSYVDNLLTYDFNRTKIEPEKLYLNYSKHDFHFWLPDHVRQSEGIPLEAGKGVRIINGNNSFDRFKEDLKIKKSCLLFLDSTLSSRFVVGVSTEQSDVFYLDIRSEEYQEFMRLIEETDGFGLYTNDIKYINSKLDISDSVANKIVLDFNTAHFQKDSTQKDLTTEQKIQATANVSVPSINKSLVKVADSALEDYIGIYSDALFRCSKTLLNYLKEENILDFHSRYDAKLSYILSEMEKDGVYVDKEMLESQYPRISKRVQELEDKIRSYSKKGISNLSAKNLADLLFDELNLKATNRNTAKETLEEMSSQHEIVPMIIEYRAYTDIKQSANSLLSKVSETGLVHAKIMPFNAVTGRLSTQEPNLQGLPTKNREAAYIKRSIKSRFPDGKIIAADYSQIELRILAHLSGDESLIDAFNKGLDPHAATAAKVMGIPLAKVTPDQRRDAKSINFGIIYGMQAFGLAIKMKVSKMVAEKYINNYFSSLPKVSTYIDSIKNSAITKGFVSTLFGRKIHVAKAMSSNFAERQRGLRQASNAPMQGTAAEIMKIAMVNIYQDMKEQNLKSKMIMQVHDELVFDTHPSEVSIMHSIIKRRMETAVELSVPLNVDIGISDNWEMSHSLDSNTKEKVKKQTSEIAPAV